MTEEIYAQEPWHCGHSDGCKQGWHQRTYWCGDQWTCDEYTDGDHEEIDGKDVPSIKDIKAAWQAYYKSCAKSGNDPLGTFILDTPKPKTVRWQAKFGKSIVGYVFRGARRNSRGPWINDARDLPSYVRDFLDLCPATKQPPEKARIWVYQCTFSEATRGNWPNLEADLEKCTYAQRQRAQFGIKFVCEIDEPAKPKNVSRQIKQAARAAIAKACQP